MQKASFLTTWLISYQYSYTSYILFLEDSSDPNDLGLDADDYLPVANSNREQRSLSPGETPGGGRKTKKNEKEIMMAMQQLEKER